MKLTALVTFIKRAAIIADSNIAKTLGRESVSFENDLKMLAPVDKGDFKESWETSQVKGRSGNKSVSISNDKVYGPAIEFGSVPGESPWPSPGQKTIESGGRIYSTQAVGGTIEKAFSNENVKKFAVEIANSIIGAFK